MAYKHPGAISGNKYRRGRQLRFMAVYRGSGICPGTIKRVPPTGPDTTDTAVQYTIAGTLYTDHKWLHVLPGFKIRQRIPCHELLECLLGSNGIQRDKFFS